MRTMSTMREGASLEERVRRLERVNRVLTVAIVAAVAWPLLVGAVDHVQPDEVTAKRIRLVDDEGRVRMDLRHDSEETGLFIMDEAGDVRLGAAQFAHGGGGYALHGPGGSGAAVLYLKGEGSLTMYEPDGEVAARFPGGEG